MANKRSRKSGMLGRPPKASRSLKRSVLAGLPPSRSPRPHADVSSVWSENDFSKLFEEESECGTFAYEGSSRNIQPDIEGMPPGEGAPIKVKAGVGSFGVARDRVPEVSRGGTKASQFSKSRSEEIEADVHAPFALFSATGGSAGFPENLDGAWFSDEAGPAALEGDAAERTRYPRLPATENTRVLGSRWALPLVATGAISALVVVGPDLVYEITSSRSPFATTAASMERWWDRLNLSRFLGKGDQIHEAGANLAMSPRMKGDAEVRLAPPRGSGLPETVQPASPADPFSGAIRGMPPVASLSAREAGKEIAEAASGVTGLSASPETTLGMPEVNVTPMASPENTVIESEIITDTGPMVVRVQSALIERGYELGRIDGLVGPRTRAAIRAFKLENGMDLSGNIDESLLRALNIRADPRR